MSTSCEAYPITLFIAAVMVKTYAAHELRNERDMAETVSRASAKDLAILTLELEGRKLPQLRLSRNHVHMSTHKGNDFVSRARVRNADVGPALLVLVSLCLQHAAVLFLPQEGRGRGGVWGGVHKSLPLECPSTVIL